MHGGLGCGKFFINEANRIEKQHRERLAPARYTPEEIEAGFKTLAESFGIYGTILFLEKETPFNRYELERMTVNEIYYNLQYLSWHAYTIKRYDKIQQDKLNDKKRGKRFY